jgi:hypothetical protein
MNALLATLLKSALVLTMLIGVLVGAVRALPYNRSRDDDLKIFLFPAGCAPPCVMGITPGVTTGKDIDILLGSLEARGWIDGKDRAEIVDAMLPHSEITWNWNADSFPYDYPLKAQYDLGFTNWVDVYDGIVVSVGLSINLTYGELRLLRDEPSGLLLAEEFQLLTAKYGNLQALYPLTRFSCLPYPHTFFDWPTLITTGNSADSAYGEPRPVKQGEFARWLSAQQGGHRLALRTA